MYDNTMLIVLDKCVYERLVDHPEQMKYRQLFSSDDYDYVECEELIDRLDKEKTI